MHSFTTQSHHRNYQGNVILHNSNNYASHQAQRHKILSIIATSVMALAIAVTGSLLGVMTIHNQQLKQQLQTLTMQTNTVDEKQCNNAIPCGADYIVTEIQPAHNSTTETGEQQAPKQHPHHSGKTLKRIPISNQQHDTEDLPSVNNKNDNN